MKIKIKNVGKIKEANLEIGDISVIVGKNNSGKSTIGKIIYTVIRSFSESFKQNYKEERNELISNDFKTLVRDFKTTIFNLKAGIAENKELYSAFQNLISSMDNTSIFTEKESEIFKKGKQNLNNLKISENNNKLSLNILNNIIKSKEFLKISNSILQEEILNFESVKDDFENLKIICKKIKKKRIINSLKKLEDDLKLNFESLEVKKKIIKSMVETEFNHPILHGENNFEISIDNLCIKYGKFENTTKENSVSINGEIFEIEKYDRTIFLESPIILNYLNFELPKYSRSKHLIDLIKKENKTIFEEETFKKHIEIEKSIKNILEGNLYYNKSKEKIEFLGDDKKEFGIDDLASGVKGLGILLMLIRNLSSSTLLVLDEPEVHMHPEWQLKFAKIICLIAKKIGVKLLITTHSTFFLEALESSSLLSDLSFKSYYCEDGILIEDVGNKKYQKVNGNVFDELDLLKERLKKKQEENKALKKIKGIDNFKMNLDGQLNLDVLIKFLKDYNEE